MAVISFYAPPGEQKQMADFLTDLWIGQNLGLQVGTPTKHQTATSPQPWNSWKAHVFHRTNFIRFEGKDEIDWFSSSIDSKACWVIVKAWNSPTIRWCHYKHANQFVAIAKMQTTAKKWNKPSFLAEDQWREMLQTPGVDSRMDPKVYTLELESPNCWCWSGMEKLHDHTQPNVQRTTAHEEKHVAEVQRALRQCGAKNGKGVLPPKIQEVHNLLKVSGHLRGDMADRKLAKQPPKLHEAKRLTNRAIQSANAHILGECSENVQILVEKIWKDKVSSETTLGFLLNAATVEIAELQTQRTRQEHDAHKQRVQFWKDKMKHGDAKTISKWLQRKESPMTNANVTRFGRVAQNSAQAVQFIYDHWCQVWNEDEKPPPEEISSQKLADHFSFGNNDIEWNPPDMATLTKALLDGVPKVFEFGRQVNLRKANKIKQFCIDAARARPITVYSIAWRAYATAWMRTPAFQQFAERLPKEIAGVYQHEGSEEAATVLQQKLAINKWVLVSLDYSQCYDRVDIDATLGFLDRTKWPKPLLQQIEQVWKTKRFLEYKGHVHPEKCSPAPGYLKVAPLRPLPLPLGWLAAPMPSTSSCRWKANTLKHKLSLPPPEFTWTTDHGLTPTTIALCSEQTNGSSGVTWLVSKRTPTKPKLVLSHRNCKINSKLINLWLEYWLDGQSSRCQHPSKNVCQHRAWSEPPECFIKTSPVTQLHACCIPPKIGNLQNVCTTKGAIWLDCSQSPSSKRQQNFQQFAQNDRKPLFGKPHN